jgi:Septum formation topological specificity factor
MTIPSDRSICSANSSDGELHEHLQLVQQEVPAWFGTCCARSPQVLLEHEGRRSIKSDLLGLLRGEIVAVICRHVTVEPENVQVTMNRGATVSTLAIDIEIPA